MLTLKAILKFPRMTGGLFEMQFLKISSNSH